MSWIRAHPYASIFALAGLALVSVVAIAFPRIDSLTQDPRSISSGPIFPTSNVVSNTPDTSATIETTLPRYDGSGDVAGTAPTSPTDANPAGSPQTGADIALTAFLNSLSAPGTGSAPDTSAGDALLREINALIPPAVTVAATARTEARTPEQEALFRFGNEAGLAILSFENANTDMAERLKTWFDNRKNDSSKASVVAIADDMATAGATLAALSDVPTAARSANQDLAKSLQTAAQGLKAVVAASGDSSIADAMKTYNASADEFTRSYLVLADLFTLNQIVFGAQDTGSAFSMPH